ncbi:hypothetical protein DPMN_137251 [Dreissena polymorpha]|uniref:Uncharacterized protein n=1 Tax=Dreissena polymorpha TaxID=45954 RepID=A0A9D4G299_DREPO|nr:hypothetical protein DPMN_137251 [Dreissena polymorpha]
MDDLVPPTRESTCMSGMVNARSCSVVIATMQNYWTPSGTNMTKNLSRGNL